MTTPPHDPADVPADERLVLLNAYVDGEATLEERARVDGDPALLAEAQRLMSLKARVADVTPPSEETRTRLLDAALSEFQHAAGAPGPAAPPPPPAPAPVTPLPPPAPARPSRRSRSPWLATAAAIVGVLAVGGAVFATLRSDGESDDAAVEDRDGAEEALDSPFPDDETADQGAAPEAEAAPEDGATGGGADSGASGEDGAVSSEEAEDDSNATMAEEAPGERPAAPQAQERHGADVRELSNTDELAEWYEIVRYGEGDDEYVPPGAGTRRCETRILGEAIYDGTRVFITTSRDAGINALDADTCQLVASTPVP